tara:strand:- start:174 stop:821 length:648 start_codon:yes stop_codon:yes gene_type:complete
MKTSENTFELNTVLEVILDSNDNDGLIFVPKNTEIKVVIENYFGKILINEINIKNVEDEMALSKDKLETSLPLLDLKLLDRYLFKQLNDKASFNYSPYNYFPNYDFSVFEKGRRGNDIDWAMFSSLYIFSCNVLPESIKVELSLAKELRISEENVKKFIKKIPEKIFRKTGHLESRGGNLTFDAEELIKNNLNEEDKSNFDENPYLKFHSGSDLA